MKTRRVATERTRAERVRFFKLTPDDIDHLYAQISDQVGVPPSRSPRTYPPVATRATRAGRAVTLVEIARSVAFAATLTASMLGAGAGFVVLVGQVASLFADNPRNGTLDAPPLPVPPSSPPLLSPPPLPPFAPPSPSTLR